MKTDDLIRTLAEDGATRRPSLARRLTVALLAGGFVAIVLFALLLGVRPDIVSALHTWRFVLKVAVALLAYALALWACARLTQPAGRRCATRWSAWSPRRCCWLRRSATSC